MKPRTIAVALIITVLIVAAANYMVGRAASNSVPRQIMRNINTAGPVIGVLGVGNSLMQSGFDAAVVQESFQKAGRNMAAVNAGMGSTSTIEHLALTRLALQHHAVRDVVYGFFDQQMSAEAPLKNSDLIGNYAMLYYLEPELTLKYARFDWLDMLEFQTYRCCALLRERSATWAKVEKMRRAMQEVGMRRQETNQFGRRADFSLLEFATPEEFARNCRILMRSGELLSPPVQELFKEVQNHGSRLTVVEMPMHPLHLKRFYDQAVWEEFRLQNRRAVERAGGAYIDASRWIPDPADFQDNLHLSASGAARFSSLLAEEILRRGD
jgi:hypothetical protein